MLAFGLNVIGAAPALAQGAKPAANPAAAKTIFAGGCFWCMEEAFDPIPGVIATVSGYMGGKTKKPTYEQVSTGRTGHAEVLQIEYDPQRVSYEKLLEVFWRNIDPTQRDGQFCDHGSQYRSGVFYHDDEQRKLAEASRAAVEGRDRHRDHAGGRVLSRRGIPSGLLQEKSRPLQILQDGMRACRAAEAAVGLMFALHPSLW